MLMVYFRNKKYNIYYLFFELALSELTLSELALSNYILNIIYTYKNYIIMEYIKFNKSYEITK